VGGEVVVLEMAVVVGEDTELVKGGACMALMKGEKLSSKHWWCLFFPFSQSHGKGDDGTQ